MQDDPPLTTDPASAATYRRGVADLVAGRRPEAIAAFASAVRTDPQFALGAVALALASAATPVGPEATGARALSRWERQHLTVVRLVLTDGCARAAALAREHLAEYPNDALVRLAVTQHCVDVDDLVAGYGTADIGAAAPCSNASS